MRPNSSLIFYTSLTRVVLGFGTSPCYYPNGTQVTNTPVWQCSDGVITICCTLARDTPPGGETNVTGYTRDECLSDGLCQNRHRTDDQVKFD